MTGELYSILFDILNKHNTLLNLKYSMNKNYTVSHQSYSTEALQQTLQ
jgi:PhoPQ-activated pathogenicity-related protein